MNEKQALLKNARIVSIFISFFLLLTTTAAVAANVTLRWDPNNPAPEGYRVFARRSDQVYNYSRPDWEGAAATCTVNLEDQTEYYFVVRAYDGSLQSPDSAEVPYTTPPAPSHIPPLSAPSPDTAPPSWDGATTGAGMATDAARGGRVTVEFDTARDVVDGTNLRYNVYYAASGAWNNTDWISNKVVADAAVGLGNTFSHAVTVSGLTDGVSYTFGVRVEDQSGNEDSNTRTLTATASSVVTPPVSDDFPTYTTEIPQTGWRLHYVDSEEVIGEDGAATNSFDGDPLTIWHTEWLQNPDPSPPHTIQIDLGAAYTITGFRYLPRQDSFNGRIRKYAFYVSSDGANWGGAVASGSFVNDATEKEVTFAQVTGSYIRLVGLTEVNGKAWTSVAEINVIGSVSVTNSAPNGTIKTPASTPPAPSYIPPASATSPDITAPSWDGATTGAGMATDAARGGRVTVEFDTARDVVDGTNLRYNVYYAASGAWNNTDWISNNVVADAVVGLGNTFSHAVTVSGLTDGVSYTFGVRVEDQSGNEDSNTRTLTATASSVVTPPVSDDFPTYTTEIPQTGWRLHYVDSEEVIGEDGAATNSFDGDPLTIWHTEWLQNPDPSPPHTIQIDLGAAYTITGFRYLPRQDSFNGRIRKYAFYVSSDGANWGGAVASGSFVNDATEKEVTFAQVTGSYIRLVGLTEVNGKAWTSVAEINVIGSVSVTNSAPNGTIKTPASTVTINPGDVVDFSGTGGDPENDLPLTYFWDFGDPSILDSSVEDPGLVAFNTPGVYTVTFTVTDAMGLRDPSPATTMVIVKGELIPQTGWRLHYVDSEEVIGEDGAATNSFDGDPLTIWHTEWLQNPDPSPPHTIQIDLGAAYTITGFRYLPRQDSFNGRIRKYAFYVSSDGANWGGAVASGSFVNDATEKEVTFAQVTGSYIRLVGLTEVNGKAWTSVAEINLIGSVSAGN